MTERDKKIRVLFVDDETDFVLSMSKALNRRGFAVTSAPDGREGLEILAAESFDVILLDVKMPGLDGDAVFRELRRMHIHTPVVMLTGHGSVQQAFSMSKEGVFEYLPKPCEPVALSDVLRRAAESGVPYSDAALGASAIRVLLSASESLASLAKRYQDDLEQRGTEIELAPSPDAALDRLAREVFDVVVFAPGAPADVVRLKKAHALVEVIVLVHAGSGVLSSELMKSGAFDVLEASVGPEGLFRRIRAARAQRRSRLDEERETRVREILARHPD